MGRTGKPRRRRARRFRQSRVLMWFSIAAPAWEGPRRDEMPSHPRGQDADPGVAGGKIYFGAGPFGAGAAGALPPAGCAGLFSAALGSGSGLSEFEFR